MGERVVGGNDTAGGRADETGTGEYPISPLLERSPIDADGHLEVGVSVAGSDPIEENDLDVFCRRSRIDPGDRIELGIFVSGVEETAEADLTVFYDGDGVVDLENPGIVRRKEHGASEDDENDVDGDETGENEAPHEDGTRESRPLGTDAGPDGDYIHSTTQPGTDGEYELRRKPLGGTDTGGPGYILELNTRATAPPGDYSLPIVLTYRSDGGIKQVKTRRTVRVRTRRERWEPWVTRIAIATALVVLSGLSVVFLLEPSLSF